MDVAGFLLLYDVGYDVLATIPPSSFGPFDQPDVKEQIDGYGIDMSRVPHRTWTDQARAVGAVLTCLQGLSPSSSGFPTATREGMKGLN
ncbi:MAG: hypothetical protein H8K10_15775 [Nitrospira sp.]|nr:hypothetical protein [Nitrospira sp.]